MKPVNYFKSREFRTALKVGITNAIGAALLAGFSNGFRGEILFPAFVGAIAGAFIQAKDDIGANPNIYTPKGLPARDPLEAAVACAKIEAEKAAVNAFLGDGQKQQINHVANSMMNDFVDNFMRKK